MSARLIDRKKEKIIFSDPRIQSFTEFSETVPPITWEEQAMETVLENMSKRLLSKIIKGWYTDQMTNIEKGKKP